MATQSITRRKFLYVLSSMLTEKDVKLSDGELRRITLWLDLNRNEIGWIGNDSNSYLQCSRS